MKITLRKAAKLRNKISSRLQELQQQISQTSNDEISSFDPDIISQLNKSENEHRAIFTKWVGLSDIYTKLRSALSVANSSTNISNLLSQLNGLESLLRVVRGIVTSQHRLSDDQITARAEAAKARNIVAANVYGRDTERFNFISESYINDMKTLDISIQHDITNCHDQMEEINSTNYIELDDSTVSILTTEGLL